jgi:1,4-dihydroxy-2-naphthoate octaprenyltransferase
MSNMLGFLRLMRLANVVTAVADVLAGIAISGYFSGDGNYVPVLLLCISTIGLYSGGIIFNDVFDAGLDAIERPERPIPSGMISVTAATAFGILFFSVGVGAAALFQPISFQIAILIVLACLSYNRWAKHYTIWGPLNMGLCRGLNLMLGVSILAPAINDWWFLGLIPLIYIASITIVSRGEVHGGNKKMLSIAAVLYAVVIASIIWVSASMQNLWLTLIFLIPLVLMIFRPLLQAFRLPSAENIGKAVKAGVIALILLNASWAGAFGIWQVALIIVILLPLSLWLSKTFAVT